MTDAPWESDPVSSGNPWDADPVDTPPAGHSFWEKIGMGAGDVPRGTAQTISHLPQMGLPGADPILPSQFNTENPSVAATMAPNNIDKELNAREQAWQAGRNDTGTEWLRGLGMGLAGAPAMALFPEATGIGSGLAIGAGQGAASALMQPVTGTDDYAGEKGKQIGAGTAMGGVLGGVLGWFAKPADQAAGKTTSEQYRDAVNFLRDRNVQPTIGQNIGQAAAKFESAASTINPGIQMGQSRALAQFQNVPLNEALAPLGQTYTGQPGRQGLKAVGEVFDKAYDAIKPQISMPVSDELRTNIGQIVSDAATPDASIAKTTQNILDKALYSKINENGVLSGANFIKAKEDLGKFAARYTGDGATATDRGVGEALQNVQGALMDALEDANPQVSDKLKAINRGYAILTRVQNAVPVSHPDGFFTPYQLANAVAKGDKTVRGRAYAEGDALLQNVSDAGLRVLGNKFPDSGSIGRAMIAGAEVGGAGTLASPWIPAGMAAANSLYTPWAQRAAGATIAGASSAKGLLSPAIRAAGNGGRQILPYSMPGLLSVSGSQP